MITASRANHISCSRGVYCQCCFRSTLVSKTWPYRFLGYRRSTQVGKCVFTTMFSRFTITTIKVESTSYFYWETSGSTVSGNPSSICHFRRCVLPQKPPNYHHIVDGTAQSTYSPENHYPMDTSTHYLSRKERPWISLLCRRYNTAFGFRGQKWWWTPAVY